jgi:hypothetical protein
MACHKASKFGLPSSSSVQLQERTALWHYSFTTRTPIQLHKATIITNAPHLVEASLDTIQFSIKPLLYAELDILDSCRTSTTI